MHSKKISQTGNILCVLSICFGLGSIRLRKRRLIFGIAHMHILYFIYNIAEDGCENVYFSNSEQNRTEWDGIESISQSNEKKTSRYT